MITLEIKGLKQFIKMIDKYPAISEKHVNKAIRNSLYSIKSEATKSAPWGSTSDLRNNWIVSLKRFEGSLASGAKQNGFYYGTSVEYGTKPHFVSGKSLAMWASKKGLNPYAVAKSIAKKGTKANPFLQKSIDSQSSTIDQIFADALDKIIKEI